MIPREQNRSPTRQVEAIDDGAEEGSGLLELPRVPGLGEVAGGDDEIDLGSDPKPLAASLELSEKPLGEDRGLQLAEPAVGSEVEVREVEKQHRRDSGETRPLAEAYARRRILDRGGRYI